MINEIYTQRFLEKLRNLDHWEQSKEKTSVFGGADRNFLRYSTNKGNFKFVLEREHRNYSNTGTDCWFRIKVYDKEDNLIKTFKEHDFDPSYKEKYLMNLFYSTKRKIEEGDINFSLEKLVA